MKKAVAAVVAATSGHDAKQLCNKLYSQQFAATFQNQGGCVAVTTAQIKPFSDYNARVTAIQFNTPTDAQVNVKTSYTYNGDKKTSNPTFNFKLENGRWVYYIRTASQ